MKPAHIKSERLKEVRTINKRIYKIYKLQRELGYKKLEEPIRHGWYKEIVLTRRVMRYKNQEVIESIFERLLTTQWGRTKDLATRKWNEQRSKYLIVNDVPTISKKQFNKLTVKEQQLCVPFKFYACKHKLVTRFYIKLPKGAYRIKFTRAYITHRKIIDPQLEREFSELKSRLNSKELFSTNVAIDPYKSDWNYIYGLKKRSYIKQSFKRLSGYDIKDLINDHISWEITN